MFFLIQQLTSSAHNLIEILTRIPTIKYFYGYSFGMETKYSVIILDEVLVVGTYIELNRMN